MKPAPAQPLAFALLVALALLGAPAFAARTLHQAPTTPKPALVFETASPSTRPGVQILGGLIGGPWEDPRIPHHDYHTCPVDTGFLPWGTLPDGTGQCGKTYPVAEINGDVLSGDESGEPITEVFTLRTDTNGAQNGADLSNCFGLMEGFLTTIAGGQTSSATSYLKSDVTLTNDYAGQTITGPQAVAEWFASHFGNRPSPSVKVYDFSWEEHQPDYIHWGLGMTVRAETDTQVIKFATHWDIRTLPKVLDKVFAVRVVDK
ncbi:hypothetical protein KFL_005470040 [Klebsormidium nitens]|uniref:Uncharacterized protein n=1 Tax=Klebsormidium nitens TaxID=105231 RepID=A0A1Y1IHU2_KLENI|nr:hypothetical protein KFL_005470040 [Klebsormidium nitens]|eukprot:GAQ89652.1 hypothetical protein KFL_005470040 [Klebsormidium nitens]